MWLSRVLSKLSRDSVPTYRCDNAIGRGTTVRGDLKGPGGFHVDGTIEGSLEAEGPVVIGEDGTVDGSVRGRDVIVLGRVRGDVVATGHLEIGPKGKVVGDIQVQSIKMHTGGVFRGTSRMPGAEDLATTTNPFGMLPVGVSDATPRNGRTLPPPVGAVPPPPDSAPAVSEERIVAPVSTRDAQTGTNG